MTAQRGPTTNARRAGRKRSTGWRAYVVREIAELAVLVAVLAVLESFSEIPLWVLVGLPVGKALSSAVYYVLFLRATLRRPARHGAEHLCGQVARATAPLRPQGQVKLDGEIWSARTAGEEVVAAGEEVRVVAVRGNVLLVSPTDRR